MFSKSIKILIIFHGILKNLRSETRNRCWLKTVKNNENKQNVIMYTCDENEHMTNDHIFWVQTGQTIVHSNYKFSKLYLKQVSPLFFFPRFGYMPLSVYCALITMCRHSALPLEWNLYSIQILNTSWMLTFTG